MSRILILGATGYLGKHVAHRLVQSGQHTVYGVARSQEKAAQLARQEIIPVLCSNPVEDPEPFLHNVMLIGQERQKEYGRHGVKGPKLGFIYCSGTWVHGSSSRAVNDLSVVDLAPSPAPELVAWRRDLEKQILNATEVLDVMILRPALIYGRELTIWSSFVTPLLNAARGGEKTSIEIPLEADARPGLVHVDDVARAFQCAIAKLPCVSGTGVYPVFDLVTSQEGMREIFESMAVSLGFKGTVTLKGAGGDKFAKAMSTTFRGSSARAEQLLGWRPRRLGGFVKHMNVYAAAFAAQ
ncbi:NAD-dependent epimerase/dehydratase family protein [Aspergillus fischeri NRRL 181]|uniref:NAD dependent epimerase/dehydratase family protein n=1 Tax=Neosartorya fischeri (strain ATCC 1020 / DSM 3700 / CBS 544.65 / FGSC A1164 / JCM 1740 / NRRL 181 / WB 181) TaxID=331117 RepID=A1CV07_NEOFI|nr:NAD dependent epimerase/dehydratase family protein [Aspergillus fischeri NRRL 181]EAW25584.1 NAD dependent epimerase/dehydratase family protein [Aspergillus fischeri NRRL 181]